MTSPLLHVPTLIPAPVAPTHKLSPEERRALKAEAKKKQADAQAAVVRVVNQSQDFPHVVQRQSVWYIANPRNGTQFAKIKRSYPVKKDIYRDGRITGSILKIQTETSLGLLVADTKTGERKYVFPTTIKVDAQGRPVPPNEGGFDQLTWPVPAGHSPVLSKTPANFVDLPPDAANLIFNGEYRGPNPATMQKDLRYHNGDLVPLSMAHDLAAAIYSSTNDELAAAEKRAKMLNEENDRLEKAIAAKLKEHEALTTAEALGKRKGTSDAPDGPSPAKK